jgi:RIO kinase 1
MDRAWLIADERYEEYDLGSLKTGKEAEVFLVERVAPDGRSCLLAHKRYRPREVTHKGELQALGFQRAANFVNDRAYRDGRSFGNSRDRRAAAKKSRHGRAVLRRDWPDNEFEMLARLAHAGVAVPFPVARTADGVLMQYIGDRTKAAPRLVHAGLNRSTVHQAASQLIENLCRMTEAGVVHGADQHVDIAEAADAMVIAPATADLMARLVHGEAPDALTSATLACRAPLVVCPAMDVEMSLT